MASMFPPLQIILSKYHSGRGKKKGKKKPVSGYILNPNYGQVIDIFNIGEYKMRMV